MLPSARHVKCRRSSLTFCSPTLLCFFIDRPFDAEDVFLAHKVSYERYKLPAGGDWLLEFDAQGFAAAVDANDQLDCVCAEDVLKRQVCRQDAQFSLLLHIASRVGASQKG